MHDHVYNGGHQVIISGGKGTISADDFSNYWDTVMGAFAVHLDRESIRQGLWKDYPAEDQFNQVKIKIDRVLRSMELISSLRIDGHRDGDVPARIKHLQDNISSEMHDIINYAIFGTRIVEGRA